MSEVECGRAECVQMRIEIGLPGYRRLDYLDGRNLALAHEPYDRPRVEGPEIDTEGLLSTPRSVGCAIRFGERRRLFLPRTHS